MRHARPLAIVLFASMLSIACGCSSTKSTSADPTPPLPGDSPKAGNDADDIPVSPPDPREQILAVTVAQLLSTQHVRGKAIDDALSRASFERYLKELDPEKLFLLQEDVASLRKYDDKLDDELKSGNLTLAHLASDMFQRRLATVSKIVAKQLDKGFDFTVAEERETDPKKLDYAQSEEALIERWRKALKLETLSRLSRMEERQESLTKAIKEAGESKAKPGSAETPEDRKKKIDVLEKALAKIPTTEADRLNKIREDLTKSYSARFTRLADAEDLSAAANLINAVTGSFDPHTLYMPPAEKENFEIAMSGSLEGIGAVLVEQDHFIAVREIVAGGASWREGELEAGDLILSVAQEGEDAVDIGDMRINKVVKMIRGPKGTMVSLTVEKPDGSVKLISIVRDVVEIDDAFAQGAVLQDKDTGTKVGYIYLPSFYGDTRSQRSTERHSAGDVKVLLRRFESQKLPGVILDMRSNGGGLLDDARTMTGLFIKTGPVVQTKLPDGTIEVLADEDPSITYDGKVIVIIDRFSASAAEIVAAALKDYNRAVIVGPGPTHGKGTVQALLDLNRAAPSAGKMGVLKLTIQEFFRINGSSTQWKGVEPDIAYPDAYKYMKTGERNLENSLPWSKVDPQPFTPWPKATWNKADLLAKSKARQAKSEFFQTLEKRGLLLKERQDDTVIPLARKAYEARIKKEQDELEALSPDDKDAKTLLQVTPIDYDGKAKATDARSRKAAKEKIENWTKGLSHDPVLDETTHILEDMMAP